MGNKYFRKLLSLAMSLVLVGVITGLVVFAEQEDPAQKVTVRKNIEKPADVYAPAATFNFEITPIEAKDEVAGTQGNPPIKAGIAGAVKFTDNTIKSVPKDSDIGKTTVEIGDTDTAVLDIEASKFQQPGVYRYIVKETIPTDESKHKGMLYSTEEKWFDVYVRKNADSGALEAYSYAFVKKNDIKAKDNGIFTNKYGKNEDPDNSKDWLSNLIVEKNVDGALGDKTREFTFDVTITGQSNGNDKENFNLIKTDKKTGQTTNVKLVSGVVSHVTLKHGDSFKITGLSENDKYTVTEENLSQEGYKTTYKINTGSEAAAAPNAVAVNQDGTDTKVVVKNVNDTNAPTGILMTYGPYALLIAVAAVLLFVFGRRRNSQED